MKITLALIPALALASPAAAHVMLMPGHGEKNADFVAAFHIGHGCDGAATTRLRVEIPYGVTAVTPQAADGWTLTTEKQDGEIVAAVWTGNLPADKAGDFKIAMKLPNAGMSLFFPAAQSCGSTMVMWDQIPAPGGKSDGLDHPAPRLDVGQAGVGEMDMSNMADMKDMKNMPGHNMPNMPNMPGHGDHGATMPNMPAHDH